MTVSSSTKATGLITILICVVMCVVVVGLVYITNQTQVRLSEKQVEIAEADLHKQELAALSRLVENSSEERLQLAHYIASDGSVIDLLAMLEEIGQEQGVVVDIPHLGTTELAGWFETLNINLHMEGEYETLLHILTILESLPIQSHVSSVDLSRTPPTEDGQYTDEWTAEILLHVVKQKTL